MSPASREEPLFVVDESIRLACARLRAAEELLLNPNPLAIENAGVILQESLGLVRTWKFTVSEESASLGEFKVSCARLKALLEGALRAQWAYIHRIGAAAQTYTAGRTCRTWIPSGHKFSIHA